jgi:hypothetical protein
MFSMKRPHHAFPHLVGMASWAFISLLLAGCGGGSSDSAPASVSATGTPGAQADVGERLFVETRFAQFFKANLPPSGNVNDPLPAGDPVVAKVPIPGHPSGIAGPFAGMSMNCRSCHFVDEFVDAQGNNMRTYTDFVTRSPIPSRPDGKVTAPRNSPPLVNASLDRPGGTLFHFDGEFSTLEDLIVGTFTGRNFGWLPGQKAEAIHHIAQVMRGDDGSGAIAQQFDGLPYRILFTGSNPNIPEELSLPPEFRVLIGTASDQEIFDAVVKVVAAYVNGLRFSQTDDAGNLIRSPFDVFLSRNGLPQRPNSGETPLDYSRRLLTLVNALGSPQFVTSNPNNPTNLQGKFQFHPGQGFIFGAQELAGLKIFLAEPSAVPPSAPELAAGQIGNCIACHAAPNFTDFKLHNTGVAQQEYDNPAIGAGHAAGAFAALAIPSLAARSPDDLPDTEQHPTASGRFRSIPSAGTTLTDLGVWNIFLNPDMPNPQAKIRAILCDEHLPAACPADSVLLDEAIARFKTPGLRDLGHSAPYMHNGQFDTLDDAVGFYLGTSSRARAGTLRNGINAVQGIALLPADITPLVTFLKSLNEDYQ